MLHRIFQPPGRNNDVTAVGIENRYCLIGTAGKYGRGDHRSESPRIRQHFDIGSLLSKSGEQTNVAKRMIFPFAGGTQQDDLCLGSCEFLGKAEGFVEVVGFLFGNFDQPGNQFAPQLV